MAELRQRKGDKGAGGAKAAAPATTTSSSAPTDATDPTAAPPPTPLRAVDYDALEALLSTTLVRKNPRDGALDRLTLRDALPASAHSISLYFSAHWCPPCRAFTPELARMHERLTKGNGDKNNDNQKKSWPVIFVSMDSSAQAFGDYFSSMPQDWLAVPFDDDQLRSVLLRKMNVQGIPTLVMLDPRSGGIEAPNARAAVSADEATGGRFFPWRGASGSGGPGGLLGNPRMLMMLLMLVYYAVVNVLMPWWRARSGGEGGGGVV